VGNDGSDRGTIAFQDFQGDRGYRIPICVTDCKSGGGVRSKTNHYLGGCEISLHLLGIDCHNVGEMYGPVEVSYGAERSDTNNVGISRILDGVGYVFPIQHVVCQVDL
jgi:hypothetical protein